MACRVDERIWTLLTIRSLRERVNLSLVLAIAVMVGLLAFLYSVRVSVARDLGQWEQTDPKIREWYKSLMMPDIPTSPCCGEADAYWADEVHVRGGKTFAIVTDDRPDGPLHRSHISPGTEIEIPDHKLKWDAGNPTGHNLLFMSPMGFVYCFVQTSGV